MASDRAIATAIAMFAEAFPSRETTERTADVWALIFAETPDDQLSRAALRLCRDPERRFFPSSGEVFAAMAEETKPVDAASIIHRIEKLGYYDAKRGWVYPTRDMIREKLGEAIAEAFTVGGGETIFAGIVDGSEIQGNIARRKFTEHLNELQRRQPGVAVLPQLMARKEPEMVPESWTERKPLLPPLSAKKPALEYLMQSTLEKIVASVEVDNDA